MQVEVRVCEKEETLPLAASSERLPHEMFQIGGGHLLDMYNRRKIEC
jgi:hypothetical protein